MPWTSVRWIRQAGTRRRGTCRPRLEALEDRTAPAVITWDGGGGGTSWENRFNWDGDTLPGAVDDVRILTSGITVTHTSSDPVLIRSLTSQANVHWASGSLTLAADSAISGSFNNAGLVEVQSGAALALSGGGTSSGSFTGAAGTTLVFGGSHEFEPGASISADNVRFESGSMVVDVPYSAASSTAVVSHASVRFTGPVGSIGALTVSPDQHSAADFSAAGGPVTHTLPRLDLAGGALVGTDSFMVAGPLDWNGFVGGSGSLTANGATTISGHFTLSGRTFVNNGAAAFDSTGQMTLLGGATIVNNGSFDVRGTARGIFGFPGTFVNHGAFTKTGGLDPVPLQLPFHNHGTVDVRAGTLALSGGGTSSGSFTGAAGTTLVFGGNHTFNPSTTITLDVLNIGGTVDLQFEGGGAGPRFPQISAQSVTLSAGLTLSPGSSFATQVGETFTIVNNAGVSAVNGTFAGLGEGAIITLADGTQVEISYHGVAGDDLIGNDVVLTVIFVPFLRLSGRVFDDLNNDGLFNDSDIGLPGVPLTLFTESDLAHPLVITLTDAHGFYTLTSSFAPGSYRIVRAEVAGYLDGQETAGSLGGTVDNTRDSNVIASIGVTAGDADAVDNLFALIRPSRILGLAWEDFNNDGQVDSREKAIEAVAIMLSGLDDRGNTAQQTMQTDAQGIYEFFSLRPGTYTITETQPAGFADGVDSLGTVNGIPTGDATVNDQFRQVILPRPDADAVNYNFGERPAAGGTVHAGQTATIGFWQNQNGQALIRALNGGPDSTQLGAWLAATFPNLYGVEAGPNNLTSKTNVEIANLYKALFKRNSQAAPSGPPKLDAQVLAVALAVYVTNVNLAGATAAAYGFQVSETGVGYATVSVGSSGAAFGVADHTEMTVLDLLLATNARTRNGLLYDLDGSGSIDTLERSLRGMANLVYSSINEQGDQ